MVQTRVSSFLTSDTSWIGNENDTTRSNGDFPPCDNGDLPFPLCANAHDPVPFIFAGFFSESSSVLTIDCLQTATVKSGERPWADSTPPFFDIIYRVFVMDANRNDISRVNNLRGFICRNRIAFRKVYAHFCQILTFQLCVLSLSCLNIMKMLDFFFI